MGCGCSKIENSPLVALCKERKALIKAASDCRYDLATAHVLYFQSLLNVGNALNRFAEEGLVVVLDPHQVPVPHNESLEKNSHLVFSSTDSVSGPNSGSLTDYVHQDLEVDQVPEPTPYRNMEQPTCKNYEQQRYATFKGQDLSNTISRYSKHDNFRYTQDTTYAHKPIPSNLQFRYSGGIPNIQQHDFTHPQHVNRYSRLYQYEDGRSFLGSTDAQSNYSYNDHALGVSPDHPPAPSPPEIPAWDYLNPFSTIDDAYFDHYDFGKDETVCGSDTRDLREVREREGIPELEDEVGKNSVPEIFEERESQGDIGGDSVCDTFKEAPSKTYEGEKLAEEKENKNRQDRFEAQEKDNKSNSETFVSDNFEDAMKQALPLEDAMKQGLGSKMDQALPLEAMPTHGSRDFHDVIKEIKHAYETAYDYGKEVSTLLEAGKLPYRHVGSKLKEFASWISSLLPVSVLTSSLPGNHMMSTRSSSRLMLIANAHEGGGIEDDFCKKFGDLSSTLEKLCEWERKLYEEVMGEEKLRIVYEKECRRLKDLDRRGAEYSKMNKVQASINKLLSRINFAVAAVDVISTRICKLRDEELYPQLTELIEGLIRMWRYVASCHQKQFQDIFNAQSYFHKAIVGIKEETSSKATLKFEAEISSWGTRFNEYIEVQKTFLKCLDKWLINCIFQEPEETPNGIVPFSPNRIGAPPVFVVCNDWYHAIEKVSGAGVSKAILGLGSNLHTLQMKQDEEHNQRLKVDYLSKDLDKRIKYLCGEQGIPYDEDASLINANGGAVENLVSMRKRLSEQKEKHKEAVEKVNQAASSCIEVGLLQILEALDNFSRDSLKAYDTIRIVKGGGDVQ